MAFYEELPVGDLRLTGVIKDSSGNITFCVFPTGSIPSAEAGYAIGCVLLDSTTGETF